MKICLKCGKENDNILCTKCNEEVDIEKLCNEIIMYDAYNLEESNNPVFEHVVRTLDYASKFRDFVFDLTENIESPKRELLRINALTRNGQYYTVNDNKKDWFYKNVNICIESNEINKNEKNMILCVLLNCKIRDFDFEESEKIADLLKNENDLNARAYYIIGDYYIRTRRYELAKRILNKAIEKISVEDDQYYEKKIKDKLIDSQQRENYEKKGYMPSSKENQEKYRKFMKSIDIDIDEIQIDKVKKLTRRMIDKIKIPDDEYPDLKENEIKDNDFDSFVAFDLETTGFSKFDEITEIGAIRVRNGKIDESEKFIFQELVHPDKKKISPEIEEKTGITNEMVKNKERIWDVFPKFMEFVGDDILVGYNCMNFDRRFLRRAGRYTNIIIKNKIYDIMTNLKEFNMEKMQLTEISDKLGIETALAHRALADAITTAKVFVKLKEQELQNPIKNKVKISQLRITGGRNQKNDTIEEIFENLIDDCEDCEVKIINKIVKKIKEDIEKPIYNANVEILKTKEKIMVNELWEKSKVMLFLSGNKEAYNKLKNTGWKCYLLNDKFDIKEFLGGLEK